MSGTQAAQPPPLTEPAAGWPCLCLDPSPARFGPKIFQAFSNESEATDEECQHIFLWRGVWGGHRLPVCRCCSRLSLPMLSGAAETRGGGACSTTPPSDFHHRAAEKKKVRRDISTASKWTLKTRNSQRVSVKGNRGITQSTLHVLTSGRCIMVSRCPLALVLVRGAQTQGGRAARRDET